MSKLREKFDNELAEIAIENNLSEKCELISEQIEQITDDAMIKFYLWMMEKNEIYQTKDNTTELLQIFKEKYYN